MPCIQVPAGAIIFCPEHVRFYRTYSEAKWHFTMEFNHPHELNCEKCFAAFNSEAKIVIHLHGKERHIFPYELQVIELEGQLVRIIEYGDFLPEDEIIRGQVVYEDRALAVVEEEEGEEEGAGGSKIKKKKNRANKRKHGKRNKN